MRRLRLLQKFLGDQIGIGGLGQPVHQRAQRFRRQIGPEPGDLRKGQPVDAQEAAVDRALGQFQIDGIVAYPSRGSHAGQIVEGVRRHDHSFAAVLGAAQRIEAGIGPGLVVDAVDQPLIQAGGHGHRVDAQRQQHDHQQQRRRVVGAVAAEMAQHHVGREPGRTRRQPIQKDHGQREEAHEQQGRGDDEERRRQHQQRIGEERIGSNLVRIDKCALKQ